VAFVKTGHWVSDVFTYQWIDKKAIDWFIEGFAKTVWNLGGIIRRWIDVQVINWLADHLGISLRAGSRELRHVQTGRVQQYLLLTVLLAFVVGAVFLAIIGFRG